MKLHDFIVNVFATDDLDGAALAVLAHIYAQQRDGAVMVRYLSAPETNRELGGLMRCVMDAHKRGDAMAKHIELWVGAIDLDTDVLDDFLRFRMDKTPDGYKRMSVLVDGSYQIPSSLHTDYNILTTGILMFLAQVYAATQYGVENDVAILYKLLAHDDFVDVVTDVLMEHPAYFCLSDDPMLDIFIRNYLIRHHKQRNGVSGGNG